MNKAVVGSISFIAGGLIGFAAANKILKDKYEQITREEIESVKEAFRKHASLPEKKEEKPEQKVTAYAKKVADLGYSEEKEPAPVMKPRVIPPEDFGDQDGYEELSLTYYSDGTLTDDNDRPMSDDEIEETVGKDSLTHFGEYEDDSVFVRNDRLKVDYEILLEQMTYEDLLREKPYLRL